MLDFAGGCWDHACVKAATNSLTPNAYTEATALSENITHRQVVYRLLPQTPENWRWLEQTLEAQRLLYNAALEERQDCYRKTGRTVTYMDQCKGLTACRKSLPDMAGVSVRIQRGTLLRLDQAYKGFFRRRNGFPRFQARRRWNSMSIVTGVKVEGNQIHIPSYGWLTIRRRGGNPHSEGKPLTAVLKLERGRWYAVVCFAIPAVEHEDDGSAIGVDTNAGQVADSDGRIYRLPDMGRLEARRRRYQRMVARRKRASKRREKAKARLAKTTRRIVNKRHDWQHHVSKKVAARAHTVVVEDLKPQSMTASAKGTAAKPGKNVRQKAGLNRVVRDTGWASLRRMLEYKAGAVIAVNPAYTSQTCAACGVVDSRSRRSQAEFVCVHCEHAANADLNAAANILASGIGATAQGGGGVTRPVNCEHIARAA